MKLLIDHADLDTIRRLWERYPLDGVTTNPSILAKSGRPPYAVLRDIRALIGPEAQLHVQVLSARAEDMEAEGRRILRELGETTFIKVPAVPEGIRAIRLLALSGCRVTATAIYTPMQAFLAAKAGAAYAAPYVNRIDNLGADGVETAKCIHDSFRVNGLKTEVLAASFKNSQQVQELCRHGVGAVTLAPEVLDGLARNACVRQAVADFTADFEELCGPGRTMLDC